MFARNLKSDSFCPLSFSSSYSSSSCIEYFLVSDFYNIVCTATRPSRSKRKIEISVNQTAVLYMENWSAGAASYSERKILLTAKIALKTLILNYHGQKKPANNFCP